MRISMKRSFLNRKKMRYIISFLQSLSTSTFFKYEWLAGNAANALNEPFKVVLTEKEALRYFGEMPMEDIVGKRLTYDDSLIVTVAGIVKDWTKNTDLGFTDFISWATIGESFIKNNIT